MRHSCLFLDTWPCGCCRCLNVACHGYSGPNSGVCLPAGAHTLPLAFDLSSGPLVACTVALTSGSGRRGSGSWSKWVPSQSNPAVCAITFGRFRGRCGAVCVRELSPTPAHCGRWCVSWGTAWGDLVGWAALRLYPCPPGRMAPAKAQNGTQNGPGADAGPRPGVADQGCIDGTGGRGLVDSHHPAAQAGRVPGAESGAHRWHRLGTAAGGRGLVGIPHQQGPGAGGKRG